MRCGGGLLASLISWRRRDKTRPPQLNPERPAEARGGDGRESQPAPIRLEGEGTGISGGPGDGRGFRVLWAADTDGEGFADRPITVDLRGTLYDSQRC